VDCDVREYRLERAHIKAVAHRVEVEEYCFHGAAR
jgi:hypothetical protein